MIRHPIRAALVGCTLIGLALAVLAVLPIGASTPETAQAETAQAQNASVRGTGLPLPRFVSLKSSNINVRRGPGQDYDIAFTFQRAGLPVEIVQEFGNWRKIRDSEGAEGWVFHSLLSGRRTAIVTPWDPEARTAAHSAADPASAVAAYLEARVVADVDTCTGAWCRVSGDNYAGWIEQEKLWGVYPEEVVED